ncbi:MAG TPA: tetratricopeptide repeat protein [Gemmatimonadales bacterium]|nr:tetratricopeptide repeat protein [Gemmatimonadales bacterium]
MRAVLVLAVVLLLGACQQAPVSAPSAGKGPSPAQRLKAEGDRLMAKADYPGAAEKYRQATELEPTAVGLRFALGSAYSFLDRRPEAIAQFRWVVARADSASTEYQEARRWLIRVGALPSPPAITPVSESSESSSSDPATMGHLVGRTEWPEITPHRALIKGTLTLVGDEPITENVRRSRAFRLGDGYEFKEVPPGRYRVVAVIDEKPVWDEKVTVEAGKDTSLILSQSSSPVPAGTFVPDPAKTDAQQ